MNDYEAKKQKRIERYRELADKASQRSDSLANQSIDMVSVIPPGQPVISDWDRKYRERSWNKMGQSVKEKEKADYYAQKAEAAESNGAISSDDPDALKKLQAKLDSLVDRQQFMKSVNAYYRKNGTCEGYPEMPEQTAAQLDLAVKSGTVTLLHSIRRLN